VIGWAVEAVADYVENIRPRFGWADHPALWVTERGGRVAGRNDAEVLAAALGALPAISWESQLTWEITEPLILFDSAYDYPYVVSAGEEQLRIDLTPGRYTAEAAYLEIPDTAYLILVRLTPAQQTTS